MSDVQGIFAGKRAREAQNSNKRPIGESERAGLPILFLKKFLSTQNCALEHCREGDVHGHNQNSVQKKRTQYPLRVYSRMDSYYIPRNRVLEQVREDDVR